MERTSSDVAALACLLDASSRPIYAIDARRQIVYCNPALAAWMGLAAERIVGRGVEYHTEPAAAGVLTDLCPPPSALAGEPATGMVGCVGRDGRLVHRRAEFVPLATGGSTAGGVLVLLEAKDRSPQELAAQLSDEPAADELHRAIRSFRRAQAAEYALESLLGHSAAMKKVQAQVAVAAAGPAHVLVYGPRGSGREHVARAIHYQAKDSVGKLACVDCGLATEESLRWALESLRGPRNPKQRNTLLLLHLDQLPSPLQTQLLSVLAGGTFTARCVGTVADDPATRANKDGPPEIEPQLVSALSTITIDVPPLAERLEDLPLLAHYFLEAANRASVKQVGSLRSEVLDQLALYRWPGGLDELRSVVAAAHAAATTHEITLADLPPIIHHAAQAAASPRKVPERIVLDDLLGSIEREVITRALVQAGGNKSAAAELLGMTRPRLYRRLVQLGLVSDAAAAVDEASP